jgi:hypothetical protein
MNYRLLAALFLAFAAGVSAEEPADAGVAAPAESPKPAAAGEKIRATVHLRDGGLMRGTVKRLRLGRSITLALQSGKSITLDDSEIVEIVLSGGAAPADDGKDTPDTFPAPAVKASSRPPGKTAPDGGTALAASRPPPMAAAPVSDLDTVYLRDGGLLRGTIESEKPDLVLRLVSGRKRTISAKDVKSIVRHGGPPPVDRAKKP